MYEKPRLNHVGEAQEVVLGVIFPGDDMDMTIVPGGGPLPGGGPPGGQYADDGEDS